jgi:thiamine transport system ATP-binding protein
VSDDAGVSLDSVTVSFGGVTALADVSLEVRNGEFFTLVGPSGCGKTTTLRTIAGFDQPDVGDVRIDGTPMGGTPPEDRSVGIVFQNYALFPHMTVRENVAYGLQYSDPPGGQSPEERVVELLDLVDMAEMGDREPAELSGGQQQRIALARALAPGPDVLLLDEPLSALDARLRERLRLTIREIQRELGTTTVYVTHNQSEALAISDRVAVINGGQIEQIGTPEQVYREPATRFVAEFVGDTNLLSGTITATDPPQMTFEGHTLSLPAHVEVAHGEQVTLCVRPEAFEIREAAESVGLPGRVESVEFTGDSYRVHCQVENHSLLATTRAVEPPSGQLLLGLDQSLVHLLR